MLGPILGSILLGSCWDVGPYFPIVGCPMFPWHLQSSLVIFLACTPQGLPTSGAYGTLYRAYRALYMALCRSLYRALYRALKRDLYWALNRQLYGAQ